MPRPLNASLLAAMESGSFIPYFNVQLFDSDLVSVLYETTEVTGFELQGLTSKISFHDPHYWDDWYVYRIQRGVLINGTPVVVTSSNYWPIVDRHEKRIRTLEGHLFPNKLYSAAGDLTYKQVIDAICNGYGYSVTYANPAAAYLNYQFLPTGRTLTLNDAKQFWTLLRQKYQAFATDLGENQIYVYQAISTNPTYPSGYVTVKANHVELPGHGSLKYKRLLSRDEYYTTHYSGTTTAPIHNLGFLGETSSHPSKTWYIDTNDWIVQGIQPNLKYLDFDATRILYDDDELLMSPTIFKEVFDKKLTPSWQWHARFLDIFANTAGGVIPGTIESAAPYTPLNVSNFHGILNSTDNNLQAAMETLDDHTHNDIAMLTYVRRHIWLNME